ncbi:hypothetical protein PN398_08040 [Romboutsia sp. 1001216sp1]|uniref:hypothetical protein n=1 Tax=unclassified Romboutsia TaxID=2626894 RepID=UPI00189C74B3|nr:MULTISPECIES: hypothetical protein [unclassified Romboutsia]MDB8790669.1 hypothetical protein [Romboutsia sp. 1001216sp1]MDB8803232.1 hypothetical protein [Romboutsia sp. 1001216sp1]MDB8814604.1 hypothetical protein [Romboutsia sp. 1001216sp1]
MKKKIFNYDQNRLLAANVDLKELLILDYIAHFKNTGKMDEHILENKSWNWITPNKIAEDLPILGLKKEGVRNILKNYLGIKPKNWDERFEKFSDSMKKKAKNYKFLGFIEFRNICDEELGDKLVFRFTQKWFDLISEECETPHIAPKKTNKKVASTGTTNNLDESIADSKNQSDIKSISHGISENQCKNKENMHVNVKLLKSSGIKHIPYKEESAKILELNTDRLKKSIEKTIKKSKFKTWNYLIEAYEDLDANRSSYENNKTKFHNFKENFDKYSDDEIVKIHNKKINDKESVSTDETEKIMYKRCVDANWTNLLDTVISHGIEYAIKNNLEYPKNI